MCEACDRLNKQINAIKEEDQLLYYSMLLSECPRLLRVVLEFLKDEDTAKLSYLVGKQIGRKLHSGIIRWTDELANRRIALLLLDHLPEQLLQIFYRGVPIPHLKSTDGCRKELQQEGRHSRRLAYNLLLFHQSAAEAQELVGTLQQLIGKRPEFVSPQPPRLPN